MIFDKIYDLVCTSSPCLYYPCTVPICRARSIVWQMFNVRNDKVPDWFMPVPPVSFYPFLPHFRFKDKCSFRLDVVVLLYSNNVCTRTFLDCLYVTEPQLGGVNC